MNDDNLLIQTAKFLSFILRHKPESIGITLDRHGWGSVSEIIRQSDQKLQLSQSLIEKVVSSDKKKRFSLSFDKKLIRANQGHSIDVDLELEPRKPPPILYHGTAKRFMTSILSEGLKPGQRHHVHLSENPSNAEEVGRRYGSPVILAVSSEEMHDRGYAFYLSDNNVWLTEKVPPEFITYHSQNQ
jgi:putative RNA 2'-phosphotransferase